MIRAPFVRSAYNYDQDDASAEAGLLCEDESLTVQAEVEESDINTIVRRFGITGELPTNVRVPLSGDFAAAGDYHSSLNALLEADKSFMAMPAEIRARFDHDPAKLIAFVEDPANRDEAIKLGIVNAPQAPVPASAAPVAPSASPSLGA